MMIFIDYHRRGLPVLIMLIMFWEYSTSMLRLYLTLINCLGLARLEKLELLVRLLGGQ